MWQVKSEKHEVEFSGGLRLPYERSFFENEDGVRLMWRTFPERVEDGLELFSYKDGDMSFEFVASRVDRETKNALDVYTVWLGVALTGVSRRHSLTIEGARTIARNIKEVLLLSRPPGRLAELAGITSLASDVRFVMTRGEEWAPAVEGI